MQQLDLLGACAIFASPVSLALLDFVRKVAASHASALITGESGSGKEMVARAIHLCSNRSNKPWVDVSCGAFPEHLVESELFGYEKGAFSGAAARKPGLFDLANGGTLFLDEIGELPPKLQVKLLRVLDGGTFYRLGGTKRIHVDVRMVTATNRDLKAAVERGEFRADLYHRLAEVEIAVPPLRERLDEIAPLAELFLGQFAAECRLSPQALAVLQGYDWPGNVRELRNVLIGASVMAEDGCIRVGHLPEALRELEIYEEHRVDPGGTLAQAEQVRILEVLDRQNGHHKNTARELGISSRTLSRKLKSYRMEDLPSGTSA